MSVSSTEMTNWTQPGAKDAAERTYASVRHALETSAVLRSYSYDVFLQGSYANATNLRGDSDVDIVVMLTDTFTPNISRLNAAERVNYENHRVPATVTIDDFRRDIRTALVSHYGAAVIKDKDKCINVARHGSNLEADVVPAYEHKLYTAYPAWGSPDYLAGIEIRPRSGGRVVNFPKEHIKNGQAKNAACSGHYKPTVRQVKRLANYAADQGLFEKGLVPGYVLECMVYNLPHRHFLADDAERLRLAMASLCSTSAEQYAANFMSCDGVHHLFRDDPGQHDAHTAKRVIDAMWDAL